MTSRFPEIEAKLPEVVGEAVAAAAERIAAEAKAAAPVRTGRLKESIEATPAVRARTGGFKAEVMAEWYWFLVEFGHGGPRPGRRDRGGAAPPHPFMIPVAERERPRFVREVAQKLRGL